jgi:hypothetical protein
MAYIPAHAFHQFVSPHVEVLFIFSSLPLPAFLIVRGLYKNTSTFLAPMLCWFLYLTVGNLTLQIFFPSLFLQ